jgi:hypothetical protein
MCQLIHTHVAIMEAVSVLALVLARYDFCITPTKPGAIRPGKGVLLHPHQSVLMNVSLASS